MKNVLFLLLFLIFKLSAHSQGVNWEVRTGVGFYQLTDIKSFQSQLMNSTNLTHIKPVEAFPPHLFYSASANYAINPRHMTGLDFTYYTTGGRNHVQDYSGEYKLDMLVNGYRVGVKYLYSNQLYANLYWGFQLGGGCLFSHLNLDEHLQVYDEVISDDEYEFTSLGYYVEPSLLLSYHLLKGTSITLTGGYEQDLKGDLHLKDNKDQKLGKTADWSGLRISLGVNYSIRFEKKSEFKEVKNRNADDTDGAD